MYNVLNGNMSHLLNICFQRNSQVHGYLTRTANNLHINTVRTSARKSTLIFSGPEIWNSIPLSIRALRTVKLFKSALKLLYLNAYLS